MDLQASFSEHSEKISKAKVKSNILSRPPPILHLYLHIVHSKSPYLSVSCCVNPCDRCTHFRINSDLYIYYIILIYIIYNQQNDYTTYIQYTHNITHQHGWIVVFQLFLLLRQVEVGKAERQDPKKETQILGWNQTVHAIRIALRGANHYQRGCNRSGSSEGWNGT